MDYFSSYGRLVGHKVVLQSLHGLPGGAIVSIPRYLFPRDGYDWPMQMETGQKLLLSIVELGGYPNFTPLYEAFGYEVVVATRMRKALGFLKQRQADVIVAEFNFQSDFRDRSSSLESLLAVVQRCPATRMIVFYEKEFAPQFERLRARLPVHHALPFPVDEAVLRACLQEQAVVTSA